MPWDGSRTKKACIPLNKYAMDLGQNRGNRAATPGNGNYISFTIKCASVITMSPQYCQNPSICVSGEYAGQDGR